MRKKLKNHAVVVFAVVALLIICLWLFVKNCFNESFFTVNIVDILTVIWGFVITFFLAERLTDQRRRNDCIEHIIVEIESFINDDKNFMIADSILIKQASCANRIKYLKDAGFKEIKEDIEFIDNHYGEIRDLYSNHGQSERSLNSVKKDIDKHRSLIVDKCIKVRIELYKELVK